MRNKTYNFHVNYWGNDKSTKVRFLPLDRIPRVTQVSSCMVFVLDGKKRLLMAKPKRGWGLPGGHIDSGETPEECCKREVFEETSVTIKNLKLIGAWIAEYVFESDYNRSYANPSYQLLFIADINEIEKYKPQLEVSERKFVEVGDIEKYHHDFVNFSEILRYTLENYYDK
jgi:8-oxo-dGTP diphosphatase